MSEGKKNDNCYINLKFILENKDKAIQHILKHPNTFLKNQSLKQIDQKQFDEIIKKFDDNDLRLLVYYIKQDEMSLSEIENRT